MSRTLEYWPPGETSPRSIQVNISAPTPDAPYWSCRLEIIGFEKPYSMPFSGIDSIDAWLSAISIVPHVLRSFVPPGGRMTWQGRDDLGFATLTLNPAGREPPPSDRG